MLRGVYDNRPDNRSIADNRVTSMPKRGGIMNTTAWYDGLIGDNGLVELESKRTANG